MTPLKDLFWIVMLILIVALMIGGIVSLFKCTPKGFDRWTPFDRGGCYKVKETIIWEKP